MTRHHKTERDPKLVELTLQEQSIIYKVLRDAYIKECYKLRNRDQDSSSYKRILDKATALKVIKSKLHV